VIIHEYRCLAHNREFESSDENPRCPFGCTGSSIVREFRTPPSIQSGGTRTIDRFQDHLASDMGVTNMHNDGGRGPDPSRGLYGPAGNKRQWRPEQLPQWTRAPFQYQEGWTRRGEAPPVFDPRKPAVEGMKITASPLKPVLENPMGRNFLRENTVVHRPKRESPN
jgi:hypothetical protein